MNQSHSRLRTMICTTTLKKVSQSLFKAQKRARRRKRNKHIFGGRREAERIGGERSDI